MAIIPETSKALASHEINYPDSDGRPVAETPVHRDNLLVSVQLLQSWFAHDPMVYVSGNMFIYYERGNRYKSLAPDVFVVLGVPRDKPRRSYKIWEEDGHAPDMVIEVTSLSSKEEDVDDKFVVYRDLLRVREYFLFDPYAEYLAPSLQGYRLIDGEYMAIDPSAGRLPSAVVGLHLERSGLDLRFYDPAKRIWVPTRQELERMTERLETRAHDLDERAKREAERAEIAASEAERLRIDNERMRAELEEWRRKTQP
ncbi:MAG TPA: Uma2 family endonuclease [Pirellulales bacterium]|nr:Uma2 family endonuclease [Pirellulales bacterium]